MTTLVIEHAKEHTKGYVKRFMIEVKAGTYIGKISARTREDITKRLQEENADALFAYSYNGEIVYVSIGSPVRHISSLEGINLITRAKRVPLYMDFYAKLNKKLWVHMLETGVATCN